MDTLANNQLELLDELINPFLEIMLQPGNSGWLSVNYPALLWLGVMGLGCVCGVWIGKAPERITKGFLAVGAIMLVGWLLLR